MTVAELPHPGRAPAFERTPPQDVAAEQSVLGGMLLSKDAIADVAELLHGHDFYRPAHETIFDTILELFTRGEPADPVTVAGELQRRNELGRVGGAPYLHTLTASVPTAANAGYYAEIVRERAVLRRLVEAGTRIAQMGYGAEGDVDDVVDRAQAEVYSVTDRRTSEDYRPLSEIMEGTLDEIEAIGSRGGQMIGVPTGFADLDEVTNGLHPGQMVIVAARPGAGKALALDTPLPTPSGWTTMADVAVGDQLLGADGHPTRVVAATSVLHGRPCYEVHFSDGAVIVADAEHQWRTSTRASRRAQHERRPSSFSWPLQGLSAHISRPIGSWNAAVHNGVVTTREIAQTLRCVTADRRLNHAVAVAQPLQLPHRSLPLSPYVLGVWLGDGTSASASFTTADPEIVAEVEAEGLRVTKTAGKYRYLLRLPEPAPVEPRHCLVCGAPFLPKSSHVMTCGRSCGGKVKAGGRPRLAPGSCPDCRAPSSGGRQCRTCRTHHGTVRGLLRTIGVLNNKHIPVQYLRASEAQRRDLLAGLLDTDGTVGVNGTVVFAVTNVRLAHDTLELVVSLGYRATLRRKRVKGRTPASSTCYEISFTPADKVFRLTRKAARQNGTVRASTTRRYVTEVRRIESVPVRCVQVDNDDHLYLAGRSMIPTHNSTMALDICRSASIQHGLSSVLFSLEMSRNEIAMRLLSAEARVSLQHMRTGHMTDDDWSRIARKTGEVSAAPLFIDDSPNMSMMEIRAKCRRLKQRHELRLVVLDYMQLLSSGKRVESRQVEVSEFSRSLKLLAKELEVPVVALSQLNRGPEQRQDKKPLLSDLRESGSLEQDADMVMLLHREDMYEKESARAGEADIILAKHRNGPTTTVTVAFQGHYSRFVDMAPGS